MLAEATAYKKNWQKAQRARLKDGCDEDSFVYLHLNADDDVPHHVGMGDTVKRPWEMKASRSSKHKNKTAKHDVRVELIADELTWENAQWWEVRWIKALKAVGYELTNLTDGGDDQPMRHQEVRDIHRQNVSRGGNHYTKDPNRTHPMELDYVKKSHLQATNTEEFKEKQRKRMETEGNPMDRVGAREKHLAYCNMPEVKVARSERMQGNKNPMSNPEYRDKVSKANKGRKQPHIVKSVIELSEGRVFESLVSAGKYYGVAASSIGQVCLGNRKTAGKRKFKFLEEA